MRRYFQYGGYLAIVMGVALLLTGIGFLELTVGGALRAPAAPMSPTS